MREIIIAIWLVILCTLSISCTQTDNPPIEVKAFGLGGDKMRAVWFLAEGYSPATLVYINGRSCTTNYDSTVLTCLLPLKLTKEDTITIKLRDYYHKRYSEDIPAHYFPDSALTRIETAQE